MSYRTEDERQLFIGFVEWLNSHDWIAGADHKKRMYLVEEYLKDREQEHAWGGKHGEFRDKK